jgi:Xaa-Pro dipeptidase
VNSIAGASVSAEFATYGLTATNDRAIEAALAGFYMVGDASDLIRGLRLIKSEAELAYMRRAGQLADAAMEAMIAAAGPGVLDSAVTAAGVAAMLHGGGDMPAGGPLVNSGSRALYGRSIGGPRRLHACDQLPVELGASFCRYHVCTEHMIAVGTPDPRQQRMMSVVATTLAAVVDAARPGTPIGGLDDLHRRGLEQAGYADARFSACGYSLGATFRPTWMDVPPMIYSGNPLPLQPGMALFLHIMIPSVATGLAAGVGQTFVVRDGAPELLTQTLPVLHQR